MSTTIYGLCINDKSKSFDKEKLAGIYNYNIYDISEKSDDNEGYIIKGEFYFSNRFIIVPQKLINSNLIKLLASTTL